MSEGTDQEPVTPSPAPTQPRWPTHITRAAFRIVGLAGVIHEIFFTAGQRPFLLLICGGLLGLPSFANIDVNRWVGSAK